MAFKRETEINMDQLAAFLQNAVEKVKTEENPDLLNDVKKVFKKNVPFSLRMYVAAYLAKQCASHYRPRREFNNDYRNRDSRDYRKENVKPSFRQNSEKPVEETTEVRTPHPRVQIDESLATTIFVGIGRNRRVFPRDLVGLLISVGGLDRDRIGDIRVLANYSFVQLFTEDADKAINALNGYDYRGRKLSVSYSRQKIDDEDLNSSNEGNISDANGFDSAEDEKAYAAAERASANTEGFSSGSLNVSSNSENSSSSYLV